ncbi:ATP-binding protein [Bacillus sp. NPDC094106]|uniref:hybrid sensor histidine kinase/response regulator n=1 Tax=Bacillus sp. NPDC094106 TaxID=3363949 RepID=UPI0037F20439
MSRRKVLFVVFFFIIFIISLRFIWFNDSLYLNQPFAKNGTLNLSGIEFNDQDIVTLNGEWRFYPNVLLTPEQLKDQSGDVTNEFIQVPSNWGDQVSLNDEKKEYGTYSLTILVKDPHQKYSLDVQRVHNQFDLYVNGKLIKQRGSVFQPNNANKSTLTPTIITVTPDENGVIRLLIAVTKNTQESTQGGITGVVRFGTENAITGEHFKTLSLQLIVAIIIFLHSVYAFIVFMIKPKQIEIFYFSIASFLTGISVLISNNRFLSDWFELDFQVYIKILYISYSGLGMFLLLFIKKFFQTYRSSKFISWVIRLCGLYVLFVLLSPSRIIQEWAILLFFAVVIPIVTIAIVMLKVLKSGESDSLFLFFAAISTLSNILWAAFKEMITFYSSDFARIFDPVFYPVDLILVFLTFSTFWFIRFFRTNDENVELVEELQKEHRKKDQFLANTAHELRNPLHGMINIARGVIHNEKAKLPNESKQNLQLLMTIGRRMSYLLNDLIDVKRMEQKEMTINKQALELQPIITTVVDMQKFIMEEKRLRINMNIPAQFPLVLADQNRVIQILFNLLHNAVKFTDEGFITIDVEEQNNYAVIHVKDTGIGIDQETQKRIFLPYEQGDSSYQESGGFGLGLSICKQLVEMHGGTLTVTSFIKQGSIFTFTLPLAEKLQNENEQTPVFSQIKMEHVPSLPQLQQSGVENNNSASNKPRVLAVDDDPINLKVLKSILPQEEYELETVTTGMEVLNRLNMEWDIILIDVMMPTMSGYELTKAIREQYSISELPILLLTARSQPADIYTGFLAGANDYIVKPVDALELKVRMKALTDLKHSIHERVRMEAAWLQAQIQPHFLFNTLNTIAALSEIDITRMEKLIVEFGEYLKASFGEEILERTVPLQHELDVLKSYLYIEKERFGKRVQVVWDIESGVDCQIPPFSIQTLVENAVRHGIVKKANGGCIHIQIQRAREFVQVSISDNGVGMSPERIKEILTKKPNQKRGIGILNTDARLKQLYGTGLNIKSELGEGTVISFTVPIE